LALHLRLFLTSRNSTVLKLFKILQKAKCFQ
jgi:hypothetical protein